MIKKAFDRSGAAKAFLEKLETTAEVFLPLDVKEAVKVATPKKKIYSDTAEAYNEVSKVSTNTTLLLNNINSK